MTKDNKGGSIDKYTTPEDSEQPGERVNEITPTNTPEPAPDSSKNAAVRESEGTTKDDQEDSVSSSNK